MQRCGFEVSYLAVSGWYRVTTIKHPRTLCSKHLPKLHLTHKSLKLCNLLLIATGIARFFKSDLQPDARKVALNKNKNNSKKQKTGC